MKFDKSKVYTALTADELRAGDKVIVANNIGQLIDKVERDYPVLEINGHANGYKERRFLVNDGFSYALAYLVERKENCTNCGARWVCPMGVPKDPKLTRCNAYETLEPKTNRNLCDSCKHCFAECPATPGDIIFGCGVGNDNVYACAKYEKNTDYNHCEEAKKAYARAMVNAWIEKHYRPFKNTEELIKVWEQKWSEKTNGQKWHDCKLNMPHIWVRRKESNSKGQLITEFTDELHVGIGSRNEACNMTDLWVHFTFLDGSPCGVEE